MKVEPSTGPVGGRSSKSKVAKSLLTVAAIGMISLLAYGAGRIWMGFRKERNIKGAFLCGDDIIIGDRDGLLVTRNAI